MLESVSKLFDRFRKWTYVETKYDPLKSFSQNTILHSEKDRAQKLEDIYEWNYDNLRGDWNHVTKWTKKGPLCRATEKYFFAFKRKEDAVAFKLQWTE